MFVRRGDGTSALRALLGVLNHMAYIARATVTGVSRAESDGIYGRGTTSFTQLQGEVHSPGLGVLHRKITVATRLFFLETAA